MNRSETQITVYSGKTLARAARIVLESKLFNTDGALFDIMIKLITSRHTHQNVEISICRNDNYKNVAVGFRHDKVLMVYCLRGHRRKGYATKCISALKLARKPIAYITRNKDFWKHQKKKITLLQND